MPEPLHLGRFDVPTSLQSSDTAKWVKISAQTAITFAFNDYPGATKIRGCLTYTDSSRGGDGVHIRLRRTDKASAKVFFDDVFPFTWSSSALIHHDCGKWHDLSQVACGSSWTNACQIDARHGQGVALTIYGYDFELSMPYPTATTMPKPRVVGVFDVSASFSGQASSSKWSQLNEGLDIGFAFHDYEMYTPPDKDSGVLQVRACAVFTDSSSGKGVFKVRLVNGKGESLFTDDFGSTWSGSGLIHHECGTWHAAPAECGLGGGARTARSSCKLMMVHTQGVKTVVWDYDLEVGSRSPVGPFYAGRFHVPLPGAHAWKGLSVCVRVCVWVLVGICFCMCLFEVVLGASDVKECQRYGRVCLFCVSVYANMSCARKNAVRAQCNNRDLQCCLSMYVCMYL